MKTQLLLLTIPALLGSAASAATVSLNFSNVDLNSGTVSAGSVVRPSGTQNIGSPVQRHTTFRVTGVDLNDDSINDTFEFTLQVTGGTNAVNVKGSGSNQSYTIGAGNIEAGESISFSVGSILFTNGPGGTAASPIITFQGFTTFNTLFGQNGGETLNINGGSPLGMSTSAQDFSGFGSPQALTVNALPTTGGAATSFRVRDLDLSFNFETADNIPEPSGTLLLGISGFALIARRRK